MLAKLFGLICCVLALCGCGTVTETETEQMVTEAPAPERIYSQEQAMLNGWLVVQDGDVRHNQKSWMDFLERAATGEEGSITVMHYISGKGKTFQQRYDLSFDGAEYTLAYVKDGNSLRETASQLSFTAGALDESHEPYDRFHQYALGDTVLYMDLIAEPDFAGVTEIALHAKEGEPPVQVYEDPEEMLKLLSGASYLPCPPEEYCYGMKLLMTNGVGDDLTLELDLLKGLFRFGQQHYEYGHVTDLLTILGLDNWPGEVLAEFGLE